MSLNDLFGAAGSKPKLITTYTSGTGTYTPTVDMARCLVRLQAGGAGGAALTYAGGGGAMTEWWIRIPIAGLAYAVGAAGGVAAAGSRTTLGRYAAIGGGVPGIPGSFGGPVGMLIGSVDADGATLINSGVQGVCGGYGGQAGAFSGALAGYPIASTAYSGNAPLVADNGVGNGSGGDSFYGRGGATGNSPAAGNYGAGGGVNAAGLGGCIEIWDFGA